MSLTKRYREFLLPDGDTVTNAATDIIPANSNRGYLIIFNNSDESISFGFGGHDAVLNKGVVLQPFDSFEMVNGLNLDGDAVSMICSSGGKAVSWQEGLVKSDA